MRKHTGEHKLDQHHVDDEHECEHGQLDHVGQFKKDGSRDQRQHPKIDKILNKQNKINSSPETCIQLIKLIVVFFALTTLLMLILCFLLRPELCVYVWINFCMKDICSSKGLMPIQASETLTRCDTSSISLHLLFVGESS